LLGEEHSIRELSKQFVYVEFQFRQNFIVILSENRTAQCAQFYKIVLHTFKFLLRTLCSKTLF